VRWDASAGGAALVRDAHSGQILGIGRGGSMQVAPVAGDLEVLVSDGVRSVATRLAAP
jgi:hypothetical protein